MFLFRGYVIEMTEPGAPFALVSYIDTEEGLAHYLFDHFKLEVKTVTEIHPDGDPYKFVICRVRSDDARLFYRAMDLLPAIIAYSGRKDFEEYRAAFCMNMRECRMRSKEDGDQ